jgi:membrane fusion protein (multidrug efflux system)
VDDLGTVQQRILTLDRAIGNQWLVTSGLSAGESLIVEGMLNVRPGAVARVVPLERQKGGADANPSKRPPAGSN